MALGTKIIVHQNGILSSFDSDQKIVFGIGFEATSVDKDEPMVKVVSQNEQSEIKEATKNLENIHMEVHKCIFFARVSWAKLKY